MRKKFRRIRRGLLVLALTAVMLFGSVSFAAQLNTGTRHEICEELSAQAESYYTGSNTYEKLAALKGSSAESSLKAMNSPLFQALHDLMEETTTDEVSYRSLTSYWKDTDRTAGASNASLIYSDEIADRYNREHVWPKSHASFHEQDGGADIHHLRPADQVINSTRSSYTMGNVRGKLASYSTKDYKGKTVLYYDSSYRKDGCEGLVELNDNVKGDVARILLYVYVRWEEPNLFTGDPNPKSARDDEGGNDGIKVIESLDTLLQWCKIDPVDTWEMSRNDACQSVTGNRNVFIDYPEFAWLLFNRTIPEGMITPTGKTTSCKHTQTVTEKRQPTCTEPGAESEVCKDCGAVLHSASLLPPGHSYAGGICARCGAGEGSDYLLITHSAQLTSGEYLLMVKTESGSYLLSREAHGSGYVVSVREDYSEIPSAISPSRESVIWQLDGEADGFTLTDGGRNALFHSKNSLYYKEGTGTLWEADFRSGSFRIYSEDRVLGLREDLESRGDNGNPLFRCNSKADSAAYDFYLFKRDANPCGHNGTRQKAAAADCTSEGTCTLYCAVCDAEAGKTVIAPLGHCLVMGESGTMTCRFCSVQVRLPD